MPLEHTGEWAHAEGAADLGVGSHGGGRGRDRGRGGGERMWRLTVGSAAGPRGARMMALVEKG